MPIRLVLSTEVLSEGLNLQAASVVVHLDSPWTPAALEQRVARAARAGSLAAEVHVYRFEACRAAEALAGVERAQRRKRCEAARALSPAEGAQALREATRSWVGTERRRGAAAAVKLVVGQPVTQPAPRLMALIKITSRNDSRVALIQWNAAMRAALTFDARLLLRAVRHVIATLETDAAPARPRADELASAHRCVVRWGERTAAQRIAGAGLQATVARRRVLARLDRIVRDAAPSIRAQVIERVRSVRDLLGSARGIGTDLAIGSTLTAPVSDDWLALLEARLRARPAAAMPRDPGAAEISAALFVETVAITREPAARALTAPGVTAVRSAPVRLWTPQGPSSESAVPR